MIDPPSIAIVAGENLFDKAMPGDDIFGAKKETIIVVYAGPAYFKKRTTPKPFLALLPSL